MNQLAKLVHALVEEDHALPKDKALEELQPLLQLPSETIIQQMAILGPVNWFAVPANTQPKTASE